MATTSTTKEQTKPKRIQLSRKKGWRMPHGARKVDRATPFGNPFKVGMTVYLHEDGAPSKGYRSRSVVVRDTEHSIELFRLAYTSGEIVDFLPPYQFNHLPVPDGWGAPDLLEMLRGRDLACWCPLDKPCHADVLLDLANSPES